MMRSFLMLGLVVVCHVTGSYGHGRMLDPASRSSAWRVGFNTPPDYSDNQNYCGGFQNQWGVNGGRCGVCGDPWQGPRDHEAGGRFAKGVITKTYTQGSMISVHIQLTANHKGWMEFRLCPHDNPRTPVNQRCLDDHLLRLADGGGTRLPVSSDMKEVWVRLMLPPSVICTQCMLQWKYNAGNNWGTDVATGKSCTGCGPQEQFYACADIAITKAHHYRKRSTDTLEEELHRIISKSINKEKRFGANSFKYGFSEKLDSKFQPWIEYTGNSVKRNKYDNLKPDKGGKEWNEVIDKGGIYVPSDIKNETFGKFRRVGNTEGNAKTEVDQLALPYGALRNKRGQRDDSFNGIEKQKFMQSRKYKNSEKLPNGRKWWWELM